VLLAGAWRDSERVLPHSQPQRSRFNHPHVLSSIAEYGPTVEQLALRRHKNGVLGERTGKGMQE
jgi:hypothetical protein